jgi:hypothetical protein
LNSEIPFIVVNFRSLWWVGSAGCNYSDIPDGQPFDFGGGRAYLRAEQEMIGSCGFGGEKNAACVQIRIAEAEKKVKIDYTEIEKYGDVESKKNGCW